MPDIFDPWDLGGLKLANRVVMAPMTRNRADDSGVPAPYAADYYRQRAGAGLIVSEATQPSETGRGYAGTPGIHSQEQQDAWQSIAAEVHGEGGAIYCQLMHTGRIGHSSLQPAGQQIVAPSEIRAEITVDDAEGRAVPAQTPRQLTVDEIKEVVEDFASAAARAVAAGMDGVELHGANGYLLHQFLSPNTNVRDDEYGGSPENRARFVIEVIDAVAARIGADRVGLRISPGGRFNDMADKGNDATYLAMIDGLTRTRIAYLHALRRRSTTLHQQMRELWPSTYVLNTGFHGSSDRQAIEPLISSGDAHLVSVGRLFISNPDLLDRWKHGHPLAEWDEDTFYSGGRRGYTDYPPYTPPDGQVTADASTTS